ncbi:lipopolysaccharide 1,6-galactosyltransferase [Escherichia coli]|uniref:lipopolysaccharide 1,6-galactosyltransferase n=1 Tax=Escherichia coli TaxID=562 RepID=UPI001F0DA375|nr:lipopolysaccharide 1,6-galactosyltransferase [Escherichia coli]UMR98312.1 lipopolysaccharide 1,6-galactosyltransferase [Escherichia coli]
MKIAFIGEAVSGFGGMETVISEVINKLRQRHIYSEMFFFCRNDRMNKLWLKDIKYSCSFSSIRLSFLRRAKHIYALSKWFQDFQPDVVICIDVISCLYATKARVKSGVDVPVFSWPHFSLEHKKHAEYITCADYHLAISTEIKWQMIKRGCPENRINVIYNSVEAKNEVIPAPAKNETATFIYVGRIKFEGQKRVKDLLDGLSQMECNWKLHVLGDGSDLEKCQAYGRKLNIDDRVIWYGWQQHPWELIRQDIKKVTALLLTSSFEGFPMTLLEALSWGVPCISADSVSGPADIIQPDVNGHLYKPGDISDFVVLLKKYITGEIYIEHKEIPMSIDKFLSEKYYDRLQHIIVSACSGRI